MVNICIADMQRVNKKMSFSDFVIFKNNIQCCLRQSQVTTSNYTMNTKFLDKSLVLRQTIHRIA